ncbi:MAG: hypothetical protein SP1CHLAM54_13640 [Chlamydiia bacterium]|nr:hypothetical protein [Chlamydiia bacterium]MCH9616257.1 hypothetical protein [Chlamydiia bacterium]MCH9629757.1 hypothetical protein [Chlamydiia bacterium]
MAAYIQNNYIKPFLGGVEALDSTETELMSAYFSPDAAEASLDTAAKVLALGLTRAYLIPEGLTYSTLPPKAKDRLDNFTGEMGGEIVERVTQFAQEFLQEVKRFCPVGAEKGDMNEIWIQKPSLPVKALKLVADLSEMKVNDVMEQLGNEIADLI